MHSLPALYFVAIIPPIEIYENIQKIKLYVSKKYNCKHALNSPPHITIEPPFRFSGAKEHLLIRNIYHLNQQLQTFHTTIQLKDYDVFLSKVIFIKVLENAELIDIYNTTHQFIKTQLKITKDLPPRPFHPHITIAFRDVKKQFVTNILQDVRQHFPIEASFEFKWLSLLKHNGQNWEIIL